MIFFVLGRKMQLFQGTEADAARMAADYIWLAAYHEAEDVIYFFADVSTDV